jgi:putative transcriptional regulator
MVRAKLLSDGRLVQVLPDGTTRHLADHTDWGRIKAMTEEDVQAAAFADSDNSPLTEEQFTQFEGAPKGKAIREKLHLTQQQFTDISGLSLSVVRDWEQGRFVPDRAARTLLKVMARNPEAVKKALPRSQRVVNDDASASPCYS